MFFKSFKDSKFDEFNNVMRHYG